MENSQSIFVTDRSDSKDLAKLHPISYPQRSVLDTICLVKVFCIQLLYLIMIFYISCLIVNQPRESRWFFWRNLLNKTGLLFIFMSFIAKLCMRYQVMDKQITRMFALALDLYLLKYVVIFLYYSIAMDPKVQQTL